MSGSPVGSLGVSLAEHPDVAGEFAHRSSPADNEGAAIVPVQFRSDNVASLTLDGSETNNEIYATVDQAWEDGYSAI